MTLSEWLTDSIRRRGWSQREFARQVEASPTEITDILKKGHVPGDPVLQNISDALGTSMAYLHQLAGYSWLEPRREEEVTRLARLIEASPLHRDLWEQIDHSTVDSLEKALSYLRFLNSSS